MSDDEIMATPEHRVANAVQELKRVIGEIVMLVADPDTRPLIFAEYSDMWSAQQRLSRTLAFTELNTRAAE